MVRRGVTMLMAGVSLAIGVVLTSAAPAQARGAVVKASNFQTRLDHVTPEIDGLTLTVIEIGNRLELVNDTATEVVVNGYEGEPYLRVGRNGVYENQKSPAAYLNRDRQATVPVPASADPKADPDWRKVGDGNVARWYDHRIHWMGAINPPTVRQEPGERHVIIPDWTVDVRHGDQTVQAVGALVWEPPAASPIVWALIGAIPLGVTTVALGAGLWTGRHGWARRLVAANLLLLVGVSAATTLARKGLRPAGFPLLVVAWLAAVAAAALLTRKRQAGTWLAVAAAVAIGGLAALPYVADLTRSQIPSSLPAPVARAAVACTFGLGLAVAAAAIVRSTPIEMTATPS